MSERKDQPKSFTIAVGFEGKPDKPFDIAAYLFDANGALLASAPIKEGKATLLAAGVTRRTRLLIGPMLGENRRDTPQPSRRSRRWTPTARSGGLSSVERPTNLPRSRTSCGRIGRCVTAACAGAWSNAPTRPAAWSLMRRSATQGFTSAR